MSHYICPGSGGAKLGFVAAMKREGSTAGSILGEREKNFSSASDRHEKKRRRGDEKRETGVARDQREGRGRR